MLLSPCVTIFMSVKDDNIYVGIGIFEPRPEKTGFLHMRKQRRRSARGNSEADQRLCFRYTDSTIPHLPKSEISSHLLWLYSPVGVGPGRKHRRPVFSQRGSFIYL